MIKKYILFLIGLVILNLILGWGFPPKTPMDKKIKDKTSFSDDRYKINLHPQILTEKIDYHIRELIRITIVATNETNKTINAYFPSSQNFDIVIYNKDMKIVWQWSHGKAFTLAIRPFILNPGEDVEFDCIWDQFDNEHNQVPKGKYYIFGEISISPRLKSNLHAVNIGE